MGIDILFHYLRKYFNEFHLMFTPNERIETVNRKYADVKGEIYIGGKQKFEASFSFQHFFKEVIHTDSEGEIKSSIKKYVCSIINPSLRKQVKMLHVMI